MSVFDDHHAGSKDIVEALLAAGADAGAPALGGATPLHAAAEAGSLDIVLLLIKGASHRRDSLTFENRVSELIPPPLRAFADASSMDVGPSLQRCLR